MLAGFEHFRQLPMADKLQLLEEMWNDIAMSGDSVPASEWHRAEAERRVAESKSNPSALLTEDEVWRRVDESRG